MKRYLYTLLGLVLFVACSNDEELERDSTGLATVTYLTTPNGLGDNGYNDEAAEGIFAFAFETGTRLRLLQPNNDTEAEQMYSQWLAENADADSAVLIVGSSVYEAMARRVSAQHQAELKDIQQRGGRVLLFETEAAIDGITTMAISRYGASYLCGAMSGAFDALVLSAVKGNPLLEESIKGFLDGYNAHHSEGTFDGLSTGTRVEVHYLSDNETGFAMPDSAYRFISRRDETIGNWDEIIFPLLGGSETGVLRYLNDEEFTMALMIGMDTDLTGMSTRIPFSMVIRIGDVLHRYLNDWLEGHEWPTRQRLGMKDGAADIVITPHFVEHLNIWDDRYNDSNTFKRLYEQYKEEAIDVEESLTPAPSPVGEGSAERKGE